MNRKTVISLSLLTLFAANIALAQPGLDMEAPKSSIETCVAEVAKNADFSNASAVMHNVDSKPRSVSGYKVHIMTTVYGEDAGAVLRRYVSSCAITKQDEIRYFATRQKGL
jgi:hypothetical protein